MARGGAKREDGKSKAPVVPDVFSGVSSRPRGGNAFQLIFTNESIVKIIDTHTRRPFTPGKSFARPGEGVAGRCSRNGHSEKVAGYDRRLRQRPRREKEENSRKGRKDSSQRQNHTSSHLAVSRIGNRRSLFSPSRSLPPSLFRLLLLPLSHPREFSSPVSFSAISLSRREKKKRRTRRKSRCLRTRRSRRCFHCNGVPGPPRILSAGFFYGTCY